jgi:23S rRNA pseudouridine1911/1915/1917 synthase
MSAQDSRTSPTQPFPASGPIALRSRIPHHLADATLLDYLSRRFTYHTTTEWENLVREQRVLLNGLACTGGDVVHVDDEVTYCPRPFEEPPADLNYTIVYEDKWFLGVNKPGNLLVHRAGRSFRSNLVYQLRYGEGRKTYPHAGIVNRLDRETSGVVLVAREEEALSRMNAAFRESQVNKIYLAVVMNRIDPEVRVIDHPVGPDPDGAATCRQQVDEVHGKAAVTEITAAHPAGSQCSVVWVVPRTGRTHQIRVHLAHVGCPVVGDRLYGGAHAPVPKLPAFPRQALHCYSISFLHPFLGRECTIRAPIPADMEKLIQDVSAV